MCNYLSFGLSVQSISAGNMFICIFPKCVGPGCKCYLNSGEECLLGNIFFISQISQVGSGSPSLQGLKSYNISGHFLWQCASWNSSCPVLSSWPFSNTTLNVLPKKKVITIFSLSESQKVFWNFPSIWWSVLFFLKIWAFTTLNVGQHWLPNYIESSLFSCEDVLYQVKIRRD